MKTVSMVQWCIVALMCIYIMLLLVKLVKGKSKKRSKEPIAEKAENLVTKITLSAKNTKGCIGYIYIDTAIKFDIFTSCNTYGDNGQNTTLENFSICKKLGKKDIRIIILYLLQTYLRYKKGKANKILKNTKIQIFNIFESKKELEEKG